jgi:hypothetical protein
MLWGVEITTWTVLVAIGAVLAALFSAFIALRSLKSAEKREHHRWLQEKRREAYVTFLNDTRDTYDAIEKRGRLAKAPRIFRDHEDPDSKELIEAKDAIDLRFGKVKRAKDILSVVGPKEMEDLGDHIIARMNLDRIYYSPTGFSQRNEEKEKILRYAGDTGNKELHTAMVAAYRGDQAILEPYRAAHHDHRLDDFWTDFTKGARVVLGDSKPE